ncbi:MAG: T9SS type A sorting domain-containing protein [Pseudarcicella sp.]|nr:T9SS type A sorting domain-containing protein [Pseudarcicella sp.]MBP6411128.1 T9SS type A sorting domain-containing protein [Pseudarcicella sp.]
MNALYPQRVFTKYIGSKVPNYKNSRISIDNDSIIKIPIVIHVLSKNRSKIGGRDNPNITLAQIYSQIKVLNEDFRKMGSGFNTHPDGADVRFEFELADTIAPGQIEKGINRITVEKEYFNMEEDRLEIAQTIQWDFNKFLNIWIIASDPNENMLGYSSFPNNAFVDGIESDTESLDEQKIFDGVIINSSNFGKDVGTATKSNIYNKGRTLTHELGHFFGLLHTDGDDRCGDDKCDDTPTIEYMNQLSECKTIESNCNEKTVTNMIENYMDYSPDACMNIFTKDQKARMRYILTRSETRFNLIKNNNKKTFKLVETEKLIVKIVNNPIDELLLADITFKGIQNLKIKLYNMIGKELYSEEFSNQTSFLFRKDFYALNKGSYLFTVETNNEKLNQKILVKE